MYIKLCSGLNKYMYLLHFPAEPNYRTINLSVDSLASLLVISILVVKFMYRELS